MINRELLNERESDRQRLGNAFVSQIPQLAGHWTIYFYFRMIFGLNTAIPYDHWIDEMAKFTANIAKIQMKDKNTPDNRYSIIYQKINDVNNKVISHNKALEYLKSKFSKEVSSSINQAVVSLKFDEAKGELAANYFMSSLEEIVIWISSCLNNNGDKNGMKTKFENQLNIIFNSINAENNQQANFNESDKQELDKIKYLFEFKSNFV